MNPQSAAEKAVSIIGFGYDLTNDIRLSYCKGDVCGSTLIELDETLVRELVFPGGIVVPNVPKSIKCDKGERTRFRSDVVSFHQMSEQFNQGLSLSGKIPTGLFNNMFSFQGCWHKDATSTKSLAFDGWFINLYNVELERSQIALREHVKKELPSTWDAASLARFIGKYGTHIIVGVKMGGKDVVHIKQQQNSSLQAAEVQKLLKNLADKKFSEDVNESLMLTPYELSRKQKGEQSMALGGHSEHNTPFAKLIRPIVFHSKENIVSIHVRRGGLYNCQSHGQWLPTISQSPDVISMSLVPITSLLGGVSGGGFLTHAVNLYLRYKPPIEELHQFLEFQIPRQWAPVYGDLPLSRQLNKHGSPSLQLTFMGPKLHVNTVQVDPGNRPVTGIRLYLEGRKSNHLAIHLQHLSTIPDILQLPHDCNSKPNEDIPFDRAYYEPVKWRLLSHVYTGPVQYEGTRIDEPASIVTKAWFEVKDVGMRKVLFLKLGFSMVASARIRRSEWEGSSTLTPKSGSVTNFLSTRFSTSMAPTGKVEKVELNSAVFPGGPPVPTRAPKLSKFVVVKEMVRGPEAQPGYWVVTGAKLCVDGGRISLKVKYSLLSIMLEDEPC